MCHCWNWPYNNYQQYNKASLCPVRNRRLGRSYNLGSPRGTYQKPFIQGFSSKAWSWGTTSMCIYIYTYHTTWWKYGWKSLRHQVYHPPTLNRTPPFSRFLSSSQCWGFDGWMEWVFDRSPVAQWPAPSGKPLYFQATAQLLPQRAVPTDSDSKVGKTNTNKTAISFWARTDHQTSLHHMARLFTAPCFGHMIHPQRTEPSQQMGSLESWRQFTVSTWT